MTGAGDDDGDRDAIVVRLPVQLSRAELASLLATAEVAEGKPNRADAKATALRILRLRRRRETAFGASLFADPSWDILLDLLVRRLDGKPTPVSSACLAACVPATTGLRHLSALVQRGLVERRPSPHDARVQYVSLTESAFDTLLDLLVRFDHD